MVESLGLCNTCGVIVTYTEAGYDPDHHITCGPNRNKNPDASPVAPQPDLSTVDPPPAPEPVQKPQPIEFPEIQFEDIGPDPRDEAMRRQLISMVRWASDGAPRTQQVLLGPSELGEPCSRRLGYKIAGVKPVNITDPWPSLVGTAIHTWFEKTVNEYQQALKQPGRWLTEVTAPIDQFVTGHVDLFDTATNSVWDLKTMNSDKIRKCREEGPLEQHRTQIHLYGLGMSQLGYRVDRVGLVAVPRSGWLSGMWVWSEDYDEQVARRALTRMYDVASQVIELGVDEHPEQLNMVPATPSRLCSFCEFYTGRQQEPGIGCPGS